MKYGYYEENESPSSIEEYTNGAHIIVLRKVNNFISNSVKLEDDGWELRDSIKVILQNTSLHATLFRKPFKGTVANNTLENGCGGINIDATRITHKDPDIIRKTFDSPLGMFTNPNRKCERGAGPSPEGRFPANLLLECTCEEVIEGKSEGVVINNTNSQSINDTIYKLGHSKGEQEAPRAYKDTGATHTDSKCPCKKLDNQSGITKALKTKKSDNRVENNNQVFGKGLGLHNPENSHKDSGGASRFFFSFKSRDELKEYLTTMIRC